MNDKTQKIVVGKLFGPRRKPVKLTNKNSDNFECVFGVSEDGLRTFNVKVNDRIIVERADSTALNKKVYHEGIIVSMYDNGDVNFFDEVKEQWFCFNWKADNIPLVVKRKSAL